MRENGGWGWDWVEKRGEERRERIERE